MHIDLAPLGIQLRNYPEGVPLPPVSKKSKGFQKEKGKGKGKEKEKGKNKKGRTIQSLPVEDLHYLYSAIRNVDHPLHFALYQGNASGKPATLLTVLASQYDSF